MEREIRSNAVPAEIREDDAGIRVEGYAAVFNEETDIGGFFREVIAPGAFDDAISRDDVVFLVNHEGLPLARSRAGQGTMALSVDDHGLKVSTSLDATDPDVQSIVGKMRRGDLDKMSFAFLPEVSEWDESQDPPLRTIRKVRLFDVSIVTTPAYAGTEIGLRSLEQHRDKQKRTDNFNAVQTRRRLKQTYLATKTRENG